MLRGMHANTQQEMLGLWYRLAFSINRNGLFSQVNVAKRTERLEGSVGCFSDPNQDKTDNPLEHVSSW